MLTQYKLKSIILVFPGVTFFIMIKECEKFQVQQIY